MISRNCILKSSFGTSEPNHNTFKCMISWIIRLLVFQEREISSSSFSLGRVPPIPSVLDPIWWEIENKSQMQQVGNIFRTEQFILARSPARTVPNISRTMKKVNSFQFLKCIFGCSFTFSTMIRKSDLCCDSNWKVFFWDNRNWSNLPLFWPVLWVQWWVAAVVPNIGSTILIEILGREGGEARDFIGWNPSTATQGELGDPLFLWPTQLSLSPQ